jgi:hypothetical protein
VLRCACSNASLGCGLSPAVAGFRACRSAGLLLPSFHGSYWLGLRTGRSGAFGWLDSLADPSYLGAPMVEPGTTLCGFAATAQPPAAGQAYEWDAAACSAARIFICKIRRRRPAAAQRAGLCTRTPLPLLPS